MGKLTYLLIILKQFWPKFETIIKRGEFSTRPRDFYDIYILQELKTFNKEIFFEAVKRTAEHRETNHIFDELQEQVKLISESDNLKKQWERYILNYHYAKEISYKDVVDKLKQLSKLFY